MEEGGGSWEEYSDGVWWLGGSGGGCLNIHEVDEWCEDSVHTNRGLNGRPSPLDTGASNVFRSVKVFLKGGVHRAKGDVSSGRENKIEEKG
ncbi:hypothetical protein M0802_003838 [Mischocyttarus mexicanus]|nr:hypothetical protein M0802_003838 [Mischocyttarus mexicanus]